MSFRHALATISLASAAASTLGSGPLAAQRPDSTWHVAKVIEPLVGTQYGIGISAGAQLRLHDLTGRYPHRAALRLTGGAGITGSRDVQLQFTAPGLWRDWRLLGMARLDRLTNTPYFGAGNQVPVTDSLQDRYGWDYYRYALRRATLYAAGQRRILGPLWLHAAAQYRRLRTGSNGPPPTLYRSDVDSGLNTEDARFGTVEGRLGFVYDTRDTWDAPTSGVYLEAIATLGRLHSDASGVTTTYRRHLVAAREFVRLGAQRRTVLALRQQLVLAGDTLPYFMAYEQVNTRLPDDGVVGSRAIRLHKNRLASSHAVASLEVRRMLVRLREQPYSHIRLWGLAYADAGGLWHGPRLLPAGTSTLWTVATGFRVQISNTTVLGLDGGVTDEGVRGSLVTNFAF